MFARIVLAVLLTAATAGAGERVKLSWPRKAADMAATYKTTRWNNGAADGDWENDANWDNDAPNGGDTAIFPSGVGGEVTTNLDQSDLTDNDAPPVADKLAKLITEKGNTTKIGNSGAYLKIATEEVVLRGSGDVYYDDEFDVAGNTESITVDVHPSATVYLDGDDIDSLLCTSGTTEITSALAAGIANTRLADSPTWHTSPFVQYGSNGASLSPTSFVYVDSGQLTIEKGVALIVQTGGTVTVGGNPVSTIYSRVVMTGGVMYYNLRESGVGAEIGQLDIGGSAVFDLREDARTFEFNGYVYLRTGGTIRAFGGQIEWGAGGLYKRGGNLIED